MQRGRPVYVPAPFAQGGGDITYVKELFFPCEDMSNGWWSQYRGRILPGTTADVNFASCIFPEDYNTLIEFLMLYISCDIESGEYDIQTAYGADGEPWNQHTEETLSVPINFLQDTHMTLDFSGIITGVQAGDKVGARVNHRVGVLHDKLIIGWILRYT
jgi:hypothetical protein